MNIKRFTRAIIIALLAASATLFVIVPIGLFGFDSSPNASYRSLDYDVHVLSDGDLRITQHIDLQLKDRSDDDGDHPYRQVYQQYQLNPSQLTAITDISVTNVTTGERYEPIDPVVSSEVSDSRWNSEFAKHWYAADISNGDSNPQPYDASQAAKSTTPVEIGWNIPSTKSADSIKFDVTMTFEGVSTAYNDLVTFQWEPFGKANQMPIGTLTGTVHFPEGVTAGNSLAWMHYEGTSETSRETHGALKFSAYDVRAGQYLDIVAGFNASAAPDTIRKGTGDIKDHLIADETRQEREWRDKQRGRALATTIMWVVLGISSLALAVWGFLAAMRNVKASSYHGDVEYWRDPPELSPAAASRLLSVADPALKVGYDSQQMSATMLSLVSKKAIAIYPGPSSLCQSIDMSRADSAQLASMIGADQNRINAASITSTLVILPVCSTHRSSLNLCESEEAALHLLEQIASRVGSPVFDFTQMRRVCSSWTNGYKELNRFTTACSNEFALTGATRSVGGQPILTGTLLLCIAVIGIIANLVLGYPLMAFFTGTIPLFLGLFILIYTTYTALTDPIGQRLAGQVLGLKRYMEDFSDFSDRGVADLALWDRYLVYATAFGISDTVLKQLAKAYPQVTDPQWLDTHASNGSLLYWNYRSYGWHAHDYGNRYGMGSSDSALGSSFDPSSLSANFGDFDAQLSSGFADIRSTIQAAAPSSSSGSGGSFSGGSGFGGSSGGSGGGSFGVR